GCPPTRPKCGSPPRSRPAGASSPPSMRPPGGRSPTPRATSRTSPRRRAATEYSPAGRLVSLGLGERSSAHTGAECATQQLSEGLRERVGGGSELDPRIRRAGDEDPKRHP